MKAISAPISIQFNPGRFRQDKTIQIKLIQKGIFYSQCKSVQFKVKIHADSDKTKQFKSQSRHDNSKQANNKNNDFIKQKGLTDGDVKMKRWKGKRTFLNGRDRRKKNKEMRMKENVI